MGTKTTKATKKTVSDLFQISENQKNLLLKNLEQTDVWISKDKRPEIGETLIGLVISRETRKTVRGRKTIESDICKIQTENGIRAFYLTSIMESKFDELNIKVGDIIGLMYNGYIDKAKNPYHNVSVAKL
jgi:hypothetical protein